MTMGGPNEIKARNQMGDWVFAGNPILLECDGYDTHPIRGGKLIVNMGGEQVYEGRFQSPAQIDISGIAQAAAAAYDEPSEAPTTAIETLESLTPGEKKFRRGLEVVVAYTEDDREYYNAIALPGGISRQQYKAYVREEDAFTGRFCTRDGNFFLTTRTAGWRIEIRETELYPLYFLSTGPQTERLYIREALSGKELTYEFATGVCAINMDKVRRDFWEKEGVIGNVFDILQFVYGKDWRIACEIVITRSQTARERYRLKFRNSLGVFEIIEITGKLMESAEWHEGGDFRRFDDVTRGFQNLRERVEWERVLRITTPLPRERAFLLDMLGSEEIYLLDAFSTPARVNVSAEGLEWNRQRQEPEQGELRISLAEPELLAGEWIEGSGDNEKPRVHTERFDQEFN